MKTKTDKFVEKKILANAKKSFSESVEKRAEVEKRQEEEAKERQRSQFLANKVENIENNKEKQESKWKKVISTRENRLKLEEETKKRKEEELQILKSTTLMLRAIEEENARISQQKALEEKAARAEKLRSEKIKFIMESKIMQAQREEEKYAWLSCVKLAKKLTKMSKLEEESKKEQAREEAERKRQQLHEEMQAKREHQKIQDKIWQRRVSVEAKIVTEKLRRKRKEKEPDVTIFMSRFRRLQLENKKRKQKEKMRKLREEEKRLQEKRKRHEKELIRRTESTARLGKLQQIQQLKDTKRSAEMDIIRQQYEAKRAVYEAQRKLIAGITEQLRSHEVKIKRQKKRNANTKIKSQKQIKQENEMQRRSAVSHALTKYRNHARNLAERRAKTLAEEEVAWHMRKQQADAYNRWVRSQYADRAKINSHCENKKKIEQQKTELQAREDKKQAELQRRNAVLGRIEHTKGQQALVDKHDDVQNEPCPEVRREFLQIQHNEHTRKILDATREKWKEAEHARKHADSLHKIYVQDREVELLTCKNKKQEIMIKASRKVWR